MKRIFLILCLITICNISYADIASTGYVDSVVATKQDSITDIETIRSGAGLGATAVQPSSLSTVATSGSYADLSGKPTLATVATSGSYNDLSNKPTIPTVPTNISSFTNDSGYITNAYHDSTKQDKLPNGPTNGIYKLVWNSNLKQFIFQKESDALSCSSGKYDIGFSQCIDHIFNGKAFGYINDSTGDRGADSSNTATYDLTTDQTWGATLYTGDKVTGIASCNSTPGTYGQSTNQNFNQTDKGEHCWCKMTSPAVSPWVRADVFSPSSNCAFNCAHYCGLLVEGYPAFRSSVFSSVGN